MPNYSIWYSETYTNKGYFTAENEEEAHHGRQPGIVHTRMIVLEVTVHLFVVVECKE